MHRFARVSLLLLVALLAAGPLLAAPIALRSGATISAWPSPAAPTSSLVKLLVSGLAVFGAIRVKDTGTIAKKFKDRASAATKDYTDGVQAAGSDWESGARAGADNYKAAVIDAANRGAFEKGIAESGAARYTQRATTLGSQRFGPGVQASEGDYAKGVQPYLQTLASLNLPPRGPKGDPRNQQRAQTVAAALRAQKVGR